LIRSQLAYLVPTSMTKLGAVQLYTIEGTRAIFTTGILQNKPDQPLYKLSKLICRPLTPSNPTPAILSNNQANVLLGKTSCHCALASLRCPCRLQRHHPPDHCTPPLKRGMHHPRPVCCKHTSMVASDYRASSSTKGLLQRLYGRTLI
jgi:hypothetical protein